MRRIILVLGLLSGWVLNASGQCPLAGFSVTDSVCGGSTFTLTNTSTTGQSYYWDLCPGDLEMSPVGSTVSQTMLSAPQQMKMIVDNGNYFLFIANYSGGNIVRLDFGNSPDNTPTEYDYGNIGGLFNNPTGIDIIQENGNWYALVVCYNLSNIIRVDFGNSIASNTATGTDLGPAGLSAPIAIKIAKDGLNYYAFVSNNTSTNVTQVALGNSITNMPLLITQISNPDFSTNWGIEVLHDCTLDKWLVYCASYDRGWVNVIDFGNTLSNTGTVVAPLQSVDNPTAVSVIRDGVNWYLLVTSLSTLQLEIHRLSGIYLNSSSMTNIYGSLFSTQPRGIAFYRDSLDIKTFICTNNTPGLVKAVFTKPCAVTPAVSSDPTSVDAYISTSGFYQQISIEVTSPNGETSVFGDSVYVRPSPIANFVSTPACFGQPVVFTDSSVVDTSNFVVTYTWDFGDTTATSNLQNPIHTYNNIGSYPVTLTTHYDSGCEDTFTDTISVYELPDAEFSNPNNICTGIPVNFTDLSQAFSGATVTAWSWDFGDGTPFDNLQNPVHSYDTAGVFMVKLVVTANTGCSDTVSHQITILPSPVNGFIVTNTCIGSVTQFTNTTTIQGGGSISYNWDFGDTQTSNQIDPTNQYPSVSANYDVTLISTATNGCKDTLVQNIHIASRPVAQFNWTPAIVCQGNQVTFTSTSTGTGTDTIATYLWDFGDTGTSSLQNPVYAYADTGYYDVTLTVVSPTYCDSSITHLVYVISSPTATFTAPNVCFGIPTSFSPLVTTPPGTQVDSIVWDFGDSTSYTGLNSPSTTYAAPGAYIVNMTVYNNLLCTGSFTDTIEVYPLPVAAFTTSLICSDSLTLLDGTSSSVIGDSLSSWLWDFGGMGTATGDSAYFSFPDSGSYNVTLIVSTVHGCQDTLVQPVSVILSPEFTFSFNEPCFGLPSLFNYIPNINPPPNAILTWNFGDSTSSGILNPSHIYSTVDTFMVSLTVQHNATGCITTVQMPLVVKPYPDPGFTFTENCQGLPVQFTDTSTIEAGMITNWNWNFGSLGTGSGQMPSVTSPNPGTFAATLTATSGEGCSASVTDSFTVFANPQVAFTPDPLFGSPPLLVNFINNTIGGVLYSWSFGDGSFDNSFSPSHLYQDTGQYHVTLIAISAEGCSDTGFTTLPVLFPYLDLAVNKVYATESNDLLKLTAELTNMGNIPITDFEISGMIEQGSQINEDWNGTMAPGESIIYEFNARFDISNRSMPGFYCIDAIQANNRVDDNPSNNSKCAVLSNTFEIYNSYPNPFNDHATIGFNLPLADTYVFRAFNAAGQLVYDSGDMQGLAGYNRLEISTANFSKGIYAFTILYRDDVKVVMVMNY